MEAEFIKKVSELEDRILQSIDPDKEEGMISDGCVDESLYFRCPIKILWILKEPYDDDRGGWHLMKDFIGVRGIHGEFENTKSTWQPIVYSSITILHDQIWENIDYINDDPEICEVLKQVAVINVKKIPGGKRTPDTQPLHDAYRQHGELLREQIALLSPNIIIGGNTLHILLSDFGLTEDLKQGDVNCPFYIDKSNRLWIDAYHPAQSTIKRKLYVDLIRQAFLTWKSRSI